MYHCHPTAEEESAVEAVNEMICVVRGTKYVEEREVCYRRALSILIDCVSSTRRHATEMHDSNRWRYPCTVNT